MNYFEELKAKGITEVYLSFEDMYKLYAEGKVTENQYLKFIEDNIEPFEMARILSTMMDKFYSKYLLKTPLPETLNKMAGNIKEDQNG